MAQFGLNALVLIVAFLLHNTAGIYFKVGGVVPDITLIALISISFIEGQVAGMATGFFAGLFKDLINLRGFGINVLTHTLIGYFAGAFETSMITNSYMLMLIVGIASFISQVLYVGVAFLMSYQIDAMVWRFAIMAALYNALISPLIYLVINYFYQKTIRKNSLEKIKNGT